MVKTVITNFYNEEYLLPWWLKHHKKIFDHGVLINNGSTDDSVKIIKKICPKWEIVNSSSPEYDIVGIDNDIMSVEEGIEGYKLCLTMGEFFIDGGIDKMLIEDKLMIMIPEVIMSDNEPNKIPRDLIKEKRCGVSDGAFRVLHNHPNGNYEVGRHRTRQTNANFKVSMESYIFWYKYSPWTGEFINRKLSFMDRVRKEDLEKGMGGHYLWDYKRMNEERLNFLKRCKKW
jgi:hypothetical protein